MLKCDDGEKFGEWRFGETGGAYSMIFGQHPDDAKIFWRIEGDVVKVLAFADIKWPPDVPLPWLEKSEQRAKSNPAEWRISLSGSFRRSLKNG